jgi:peptidoglycan hydrolase-like protein with peptidoglycan-binding domain
MAHTIRRRLAGALLAVSAATGLVLLDGAAPAADPVDAACGISATLRIGARGEPVRCLQTTLNEAGFASGPVDGVFGSVTYRAAVAFQRSRGLIVDGVVGPQTGGALGIWGGGAAAPNAAAAAVEVPAGSCGISATLRIGSRGDAVRCLQSTLNGAGFNSGPVDGAFGSVTSRAVVAFQRSRGLFVDGVVGPQTGTALGIWGAASGGGGAPAAPSTNCAPPAGVPEGAGQVVVVNSSGATADVDLLVNNGGGWECARMDMSGRVGRNGVRALADRRSGDGTTPGGVFGLGTMTAPDGQTFQFFGNGANPGVNGGWRQVRSGDCWGATPGTSDYNVLVSRSAGNCTSPDEYFPNITGAYSQAALIDANMGPNRSGDQPGEPPLAAAIFLHRHSYDGAGNAKATAGCVSLNADNLAYVLRRLVPGQAVFVIR